MGNLTSSIASASGLSSSFVTAVLFTAVIFVFSVATIAATGRLLVGILTLACGLIAGVALGFLPVWAIFIYGLVLISLTWVYYFELRPATEKGEAVSPLRQRMEERSKAFAEYHNNLDEILGIRTKENSSCTGLHLYKNEKDLSIGEGWDWYIIDKLPDAETFKVVGLHGSDETKNKVYLLGKIKGRPFLEELPIEYLDKDMKDCEKYMAGLEANLMLGLIMSVVGQSLIKNIVDGAGTTGKKAS